LLHETPPRSSFFDGWQKARPDPACVPARTPFSRLISMIDLCFSKAEQEGRRKTALFFPGCVGKRTEHPATEEESRRYDARGQNLGAVRRNLRPP